MEQCVVMPPKKITRTWKIEEDVAEALENWAVKTHTPLGEAVQLGIWITLHISPDQRQAMLEQMDSRSPIAIRLAENAEQSIDQQSFVMDRLKKLAASHSATRATSKPRTKSATG